MTGDIDFEEFDAWIQRSQWSIQGKLRIMGRILIGLVQVVKDAPELLQQEHVFPEIWQQLKLLAVDVRYFVPCIPFNYYQRFILNTIAAPFVLMVIVWITWTPLCTKKLPTSKSDSNDRYDALALARKGDYYTAFILVYPTCSK